MARPRLGDGGTERLHLIITEEEVEAIETWRYKNRIPSKSETIRRLCQIGLAYDQGGLGLLQGSTEALSVTLDALKLLETGDDEASQRATAHLRIVLRKQLDALEAALSTLKLAEIFEFGPDTHEMLDLLKLARRLSEKETKP